MNGENAARLTGSSQATVCCWCVSLRFGNLQTNVKTHSQYRSTLQYLTHCLRQVYLFMYLLVVYAVSTCQHRPPRTRAAGRFGHRLAGDPRLELWPHDVLVNNSGATAWRYPSFTAKWGKYNHAISSYCYISLSQHYDYEGFEVNFAAQRLWQLRIDVKQMIKSEDGACHCPSAANLMRLCERTVVTYVLAI